MKFFSHGKNQSKTNILFVGEGVSIAHVTRAYALSESLNRSEYKVFFATDKRFKKFITNPQTTYHELESETPDVFYEKIRTGKPIYSYDRLKEYLEEDKNLLINCQPSIVVSDFRLSMAIACELYGIPFVSLSNGYWSPYTTIKTPIPDHPIVSAIGKRVSKIVMPIVFPIAFKKNISAIIKLRKEVGLKPLNHAYEAYCGMDHVLYMDIPELTPTKSLSEKHHFIGPVLWEPDCEMPNWKLDANKKTIYLTLGSSGALEDIEQLIDLLLQNNFQVITSCKAKERKGVFQESFLPGIKIAQVADLFICHGGSGTVYQALSSGRPVLGVCGNLDQQLAMSTLVEKNVAKCILKKDATSEILVHLAKELIANASGKPYLKYLQGLVVNSDAKTKFKQIMKYIVAKNKSNI